MVNLVWKLVTETIHASGTAGGTVIIGIAVGIAGRSSHIPRIRTNDDVPQHQLTMDLNMELIMLFPTIDFFLCIILLCEFEFIKIFTFIQVLPCDGRIK